VPKPIRAFVAVDATREVAKQAAQLIRVLSSATAAQVKWNQPDQMHFTLKFLGEIEITESAEICQALKRAAMSNSPFEIDVQGAGAFPSLDRPRTVWLGVGDGSAELEALQGAVDAELLRLGYRPEPRRFQGHLTIGRVKEGRVGPELGQAIAQWQNFDAGSMPVRDVRLYSSVLRPEGPVYEVLGRARLGGENRPG